MSRQNIPEDAENAAENDIDGNQVESCQNIGATNASYKERDSIATTLEDVQIRMMHQDYPQNYDLAFKAQENLRIPSISGTSNVGDELYGKHPTIDGEVWNYWVGGSLKVLCTCKYKYLMFPDFHQVWMDNKLLKVFVQ